MKYSISELRMNEVVIKYLDNLFDVNRIDGSHPVEYDSHNSEYLEDNTIVKFYFDNDEIDTCFIWYGCENYPPDSDVRKQCPIISIDFHYGKILNSYFGDFWKKPFKLWFTKNFNLPVKTIDA